MAPSPRTGAAAAAAAHHAEPPRPPTSLLDDRDAGARGPWESPRLEPPESAPAPVARSPKLSSGGGGGPDYLEPLLMSPSSSPAAGSRRASAASCDGEEWVAAASQRQRQHRPRQTQSQREAAGRGPLGARLRSAWMANRAPAMVVLSQMCGAVMNMLARLLETGGGSGSSSGGEGEGEGEGESEARLHPMQVLFARMAVTLLASGAYMAVTARRQQRRQQGRNGGGGGGGGNINSRAGPIIPGGILGPREVRPLLAARGLTGFFGIYGMWYSVMYLPLAEATVLSFLAPNIAGWLCWVFLRDPFTRREQAASLLALAGVVVITRPLSLFTGGGGGGGGGGDAAPVMVPSPQQQQQQQYPGSIGVDLVGPGFGGGGANANATMTTMMMAAATAAGEDAGATGAAQRLAAIGMGLVGALGSAASLVVLRWIGPRAHALHSVNYFAAWCVVVSGVYMAVYHHASSSSSLSLSLSPPSPRQCALLLAIGASGFGTQYALTKGMAWERSNRATAMIYTHVLFAAGFDRWVFGTDMGWWTSLGCWMVVGSAVWVAVGKEAPRPDPKAASSSSPSGSGGAGVNETADQGGCSQGGGDDGDRDDDDNDDGPSKPPRDLEEGRSGRIQD